MKKILFATTALVATAGVAAADVTLSGYGRFGIDYIEGRTLAGANNETAVSSRFRLSIDGSTEADNGLSFGARIRFEQDGANEAIINNQFNSARFYAKAGGLEVGVGNILGAMDSLPGIYSGSLGLTGLGWGNVVTNFNSHTYDSKTNGVAPEGVELIYSGGNWTAHLSHGDLPGRQLDRTEIGGSFTFNDWTIGMALATRPDALETGTNGVLTIGGKLGAANIGLAFAQNEYATVKRNAITLSGSFEVGAATTIKAYIAKDEVWAPVPGRDEMAYGIGVSHNLGGGASIQGGIVDLHGQTRADLGVLFNF